MRAAGYTRVSTDEQAREGVSLGDQEHRVREFIAEQGWECIEVFADRGVSGSVPFAARPAGARALAAGADRIVVVAWDRLGRDAADLLPLFRDHPVVSITEQGEPQLLREVRAVIAGEERRRIIARTRAAAEAIHREGRYNGPPPLGYRFAGGRLEPVPAQIVVVLRIFSEFAAGRGISAITRGLNADHVPTVRGGTWRTATVRSVLTNPVYVGRVRHHGDVREGLHDAVVPGDLWTRATSLLAARHSMPGKGRGRKPSADHLFCGGLLRCGECGEAMVPRTNGGYEDYLCNGRQIRGCRMPHAKRRDVDPAVYRYFCQVGLDVEATREAVRQSTERRLVEIGALRADADRELARAREAVERVERDYLAGDLGAESYQHLTVRAADELQGAEAEAERLAASEAEIERDSAHVDAERVTLQRLTEIRRAIAGEVRSAEGVEAVRAALVRLFDRFVLHRGIPAHAHVELIGRAWIEPVVRDGGGREPLLIGTKDDGPSPDVLCFAPIEVAA